VGNVRERNEDALVHRKTPLGYFAGVADGTGSQANGQKAAAVTLASFLGCLQSETADPAAALREGFAMANANLRICSQESGDVMGATCVVALLSGGRLHVGHVGDARLYLLRGANLYCLTRDHSLMQEFADTKGPDAACELAPSLQRIMSRAVGASDEITPAIREPVVLASGDTIMLCTDGLSCVTEVRMIRRVLAGSTPREAALRLVEMSNESGGKDNATVVVLRVDTDDPAEALPVLSMDKLMSIHVQTSDGERHPIIDVVLNPNSWAVTGLILDLAKVKPGAACMIPIHDVGPLSACDAFITTPQRSEALLHVNHSVRHPNEEN